MTTATEKELELARLAVRRSELTEELNEIRQQMRTLVRSGEDVNLPVVTTVDGCAVFIGKPQYGGGLPQCKVVRFAPPEEER